MSRFFISPKFIKDNNALIAGEEAHHVLDVMRLKRGDALQFFDGTGKVYYGRIVNAHSKEVRVEIERVREDMVTSNVEVTLVQALPRKNRMECIVEKCTELGVNTIIPIHTHRAVVKLDRKRAASRHERWQRIAQEASKQCGRTRVPQVKGLTSWHDVLSFISEYDLGMLACLSEGTQNLRNVLGLHKEAKRVIMLIGPEGDFTPSEIDQACNAGCIPVSLGENVLKSDTAAISMLAVVNYELNR
jgi:16S rRNA (uracil1498-N3)-methyltransferase